MARNPMMEYVKANDRPIQPTALDFYMKSRGISLFEFGRRLQVDWSAVKSWCNGQALPTLVNAFKIEKFTEGNVPAESWLSTDIGRIQWNTPGRNWDRLEKQRQVAREKFLKRESNGRIGR